MNTSPATWRLIQSAPAHGAWNMAVDEAILEAIGGGEALPTLRLYAWSPPCLSLGYAQPFQDVDQAALRRNGWELVRRPTGGRAILHTDELTYSVAGPPNEPRLAGSVLESYRVLAQALLRALHLLGIPAQALEKPAPAPGWREQNPVCFEVPSNYEITVGGKKLIGSAQARRKEGVLQHGSLPLFGDLGRITEALSFPDQAARQTAAQRLLERAATAEGLLGFAPTWEQAAQAFVNAFSESLHLELIPSELTPAELRRAEALLGEKYANPGWIERV
ncbi:MAG: biotin/lipoate A/B protein ligase family protein [Chloroflexota bacterium]